MSKSSDLLRVVEVAYDVDAPDDLWLRRVADAVRPHMDDGLGLAAFEYRLTDAGVPEIVQQYHAGIPVELAQIYPSVFATMDPEIRKRPFRMGPCVTGSQMMGKRAEFRDEPHMKQHVHRFGMYDSLWVTAAEPSGRGCGFHSGRKEVAWATPAEVQRWGQVAAHLAAGVRLRHRLRQAESVARANEHGSPGDVDAVFDPDGKCHHAEGEATTEQARNLLRHAVRVLEKARGPQRESHPDTALHDWKALVHGRWSLLDQIEHDGRRYIVARQNDPRARGPAALTQRERQVIGYAKLGHHNQLIAYELGISHSTVRVLFARAAAKLGVASRDELLQAVGGDLVAEGEV